MLCPGLEEELRSAKVALESATTGNIIELCKRYLSQLAEYRSELYKLPKTLDLGPPSSSSTSREDVNNTRKAVRAAIERTTQERNRIEALVLSFTGVSAYAAVETFNRQKYKGRTDWKLNSGGVHFNDGDKIMTIQEAVDTASLLRREEHIAGNRGTKDRCLTVSPDISHSDVESPKEVNDDCL